MRRRVLVSALVFLLALPLIVFLLSFTTFFNNQVRSLLTSIVDNQTNARLYLGEIQGSILGTFTIDGAALICEGRPIALVDTIRISHFPLSLVAKTVEALNVELVNPRFYLAKCKDGTMNVDHISKSQSPPGGKFDWTIILKSLRLTNGEFSFFDSTVSTTAGSGAHAGKGPGGSRFDGSHFTVSHINADLGGNITGEDLTATVEKMSLDVNPPGFSVDSLRFGFFTSAGGTEVSNFALKSEDMFIGADLTLMGQSLLDRIDLSSFRRKQMSATIEARNVDIEDVTDFIDIPLRAASKLDLSLFASGNLDTLRVKRFTLSSDSSVVPLTATLYHVADGDPGMRIQAPHAVIKPSEIYEFLKDAGVPDLRKLPTATLDASVTGKASDISVGVKLDAGVADIEGTARLNGGRYAGNIAFRGLDVGQIVNSREATTRLNGAVTFSLLQSAARLPSGTVEIAVDSSSFNRTAIGKSSLNIASTGDSIYVIAKLLSSDGNLNGNAKLNLGTSAYSGIFAFSELNLAPFAGAARLRSSLTGVLNVSGEGFNIDSSRTAISMVTDSSMIGTLAMDESAFALTLDTRGSSKTLSLRSPYVDVDVAGNFVPLDLPSELSDIFRTIADSLTDRLTGRADSSVHAAQPIPQVSATVDVKVKDPRLFGQLSKDFHLAGNPAVHIRLSSGHQNFSLEGSVSADSLYLGEDSLKIDGSDLNVRFGLTTDGQLSLWQTGNWNVEGNIGSLRVNNTHLAAKILRVGYTSSDTADGRNLSITVLGSVDTVLDFYVDATAGIDNDTVGITMSTLLGRLYGVSLTAHEPVHVIYTPEVFAFDPLTFSAAFNGGPSTNDSRVIVGGKYSLATGADLAMKFFNVELSSLQRLVKLDTNSLALTGKIAGEAAVAQSDSGIGIRASFTGQNIVYNGAKTKLASGRFVLDRNDLSLDARLSKESDSTLSSLRVDGNIPLSDRSAKKLQLSFSTDSLDISFLAPLLSGVQNFGGLLSGTMIVSGTYSSPSFSGSMRVDAGKIRLAANGINYVFDGKMVGDGGDIRLDPVVLRNLPGDGGESMRATGMLRIASNTIERFAVNLDGSLLVLNSTTRDNPHGISGVAVVGSGSQGLRLGGSLTRPMLEGTLNIQSADLTLIGLQKSESSSTQEIVYHFASLTASGSNGKSELPRRQPEPQVAPSGSLVDSLRYDLEIETRENVSLRMVFNQTTNEELYALLVGRLHLSNLSGRTELNGDVSVQNNSYYNFYKQFAASGKLSFTGDPLNPSLDITAEYQGEHADTSASQPPQTVVVQLKITGTFNSPGVNISMTVDNSPYPGDPQTNAISFIVFNQFEDELTTPVRRSAADNLMNQAGAGVLTAGSSVLSGVLTNLLGREFKFIRSASLRYSSLSAITDPDLSITGQIGPAIIRLGGQVFSDINNTDVSVDYPLAEVLGNRLYLELSRRVSLNNRAYYQRETVNMLKLFYQVSF